MIIETIGDSEESVNPPLKAPTSYGARARLEEPPFSVYVTVCHSAAPVLVL